MICSLKGIAGKKYPHTFFRSIIIGACGFVLVFGLVFIPTTYIYSYHGVEYSRLLNMLTVGSFTGSLYYALGASAVLALLSRIGRFCKFSGRKKHGIFRKYDED